LVDDHLQPVKKGEEGEILICGAGVGRGYYKDETMTKEKFIDDPFNDDNGRAFRTGDYARALPDGNLEFTGRRDQQVKIDGFRIELPEIDTALACHPRISQVFTIVEKKTGRKRIIAYYTTHDNQPVDPADLRSFLKKQIPVYMLPQALIYVEQFPITENGKIDRALLPKPFENEQDKVIPAKTDLEIELLNIFHEVFENDTFGLEANFFALGGNSLQAARILTRIECSYGVTIPFSELYQFEDIRALTVYLEGIGKTEVINPRSQIMQCNLTGKIPLSYSQERMWFLAQSEPDNPSLHSSFAMLIDGQLDIDILKRSLDKLIMRHAILRTVFRMEDGQPSQIILPEVELPFQQIDISNEKDPMQDYRSGSPVPI
jgi:acyl carrier protein